MGRGVALGGPVCHPEFSRGAARPGLPEGAAPVCVANSLFIPTDDQQRKERVLEGMAATPQHVMVSAFEGLRDYDPNEAM
jgi:hypothetical protein